MTSEQQARDSLMNFFRSLELKPVLAVVDKVEGNWCNVSRVDNDAKVYNVRINAAETSEGITVTPKIGSTVLITFSSVNSAHIVMFSEVERVKIASVDADFLETLERLIDAIKAIQVMTPQGVSEKPLNALQFDDVLNDFKKIFV